MKLEIVLTKADIIKTFVNSLEGWFVVSIFLLIMWGITIALLVSKKWVIIKEEKKTKPIKDMDWLGLTWAYSSLILVWVFYLVRDI